MAGQDKFSSFYPAIDSPATQAFVIDSTAVDSTLDFGDSGVTGKTTRAVFCMTSGAPVFVLEDDSTAVAFTGMTAGIIYPLRIKRCTSLGGGTYIGLY